MKFHHGEPFLFRKFSMLIRAWHHVIAGRLSKKTSVKVYLLKLKPLIRATCKIFHWIEVLDAEF